MGASRGRLSAEQKEAIYELRKAGCTGPQIQKKCAQGYKPRGSDEALPPFSVTPAYALDISRRMMAEREELYAPRNIDGLTKESLQNMAGRLVLIAEREIARQDRLQKQGKLKAAAVAGLVDAIARLQRLYEKLGEPPTEGGEASSEDDAGEQKPPDWVGDWLADGDQENDDDRPDDPPQETAEPVADEPV